MMSTTLTIIALVLVLSACSVQGWQLAARQTRMTSPSTRLPSASKRHQGALSMNLFNDAFRFFSNMKKEASAKHILMKGPDAAKKLELLKAELLAAPDISTAFSELAAKVSECPSASRGGNLGTFKPGMMVREFDQVCFESEVGKVHGPVETQFGAHLIFITRRYEGEPTKA